MKEKRMGVGFIGCGGHCCGSNIPCAARNPKLKIIGFCDLRQEPLEKLKEQYNSKFITNDMERIFSDPEIGMVICATKPDFRLPVMELAVKYKKPLFVEKPVAYTYEDTLKAVSIMKNSGVPFIVGFNRPYSPMMQAIRPIYERQKNGNTLISYRIVGEGHIWPPEHQHAVYVKKESTVLHETTHIFDLLNWLTRSAPVKVYMTGGGNIDNMITLTYPDNVFSNIMAGDNGTVGYPKEKIDINTNYGTIVGDFFAEMWAVRCGDDSGKTLFPYMWNGKKGKMNGRKYAEVLWKWRDGVTEEQRKTGHYFGEFPAISKGHYEQQEYFRKCIISGKPPETDVLRGAIANITGWKAVESWQKGQVVDLDFSFLNEL
ncbi:MAG: hypothetical protein A2017_08020 [Lentisphaerae bacterium GWF2_44_16]|nr:MAG: hypothetical protein A2017_08020 [Lentisphaerae bacterium GWF2_44_16]